jgi:hypothetical protein
MDNICTICFENDCNTNFCLLRCNHYFHLDCILEWVKQNGNSIDIKTSDKLAIPFCPYCRGIALIDKTPDKYDTFYKYYYFTKFNRKKCNVIYCDLSEFPNNGGKCSRHFYPLIDKYDLKIIMDKIFCYFFLPLNIRKILLYFAIHCFDHNLKFLELYSQLDNLLNILLSQINISNDEMCHYIGEFLNENEINLQSYYL